jgi:hypothetical protein
MWQTLLLLRKSFDLNKNSKLMNVLNAFNLQILEYLSNVFDKSKTTKLLLKQKQTTR